jgi:glycosyltransferase involved in cell wall biosynthesis
MVVRKSNMPLIHHELGSSFFVGLGLKYVHFIAKEIIAQNSQMRGQLISIDTKLANKIKVLHNPVEPELRKLSKCQQDIQYDEYFVAIGRVCEQKNYEFLIKAFAEFKIKTKSSCNLVIVGNLENSKYESCLELCEVLGLNQSIHFLGEITNPFPLLKDSLALVSSSIYEGFPNAVIEALTLGKRVIVSNILEIYPEILNEDVDIICDLSVKSFSQAFEKVYRERGKMKRVEGKMDYNNNLLSYFEKL